MSKLTGVQRAILGEVAAGGSLRWEMGKGTRVGNRRVRPVTLRALKNAGLLETVPHEPLANRVDYRITEAGYEALGIKLEATGPGATEGMVTEQAEKPVQSCLYVLGLGLIDLPEMAAEDQANLLSIVRRNVPDFGHRVEFLESGIVDLGNQVVLLMSSPDEPVYLAIFCEDEATALAIVTVYAREEGMELAGARKFDGEGRRVPFSLEGF